MHVALDGAEVGLGFVADGVGGLPAIDVQGVERGVEDVESGLKGCGWESGGGGWVWRLWAGGGWGLG